NQKGDYCIILRLSNPVLQYSADPNAYDQFHQLYVNVLKIMGEGFVIQKQDIFRKALFNSPGSTAYLQKKYDAHFSGRVYTRLQTFLVITRKVSTGLYTFNER